jgi:TRAP-type C4-dicarboxylate transport system substrate-binding protein
MSTFTRRTAFFSKRNWFETVVRYAVAVCLVAGAPAAAGHSATDIKVALVTPEGSTWTNTLRQMAAEVESLTGGDIRFRIYPGAVSGDELDVLRKMRVNLIHAAGFSGVGLGVILPEIRILEAPLLFQGYPEVDAVKDALYGRFSEGFLRKGYVLLGFAEAGFVYFFSKQPLTKDPTLGHVKMWAWKGDPVAETFLRTFGIKTFPLHLTDVNTGLETGMIDAFYSPPLAALAFQWYAKVGYMLDYPMVNSTGALLMNKSMFDRLSAEHQRILRTSAEKFCRQLVDSSRKENQEALIVLKEAGIAFEAPTEAMIRHFNERAQSTYTEHVPGLYPEDLFREVQGLLRQYRQSSRP